MDATTDSALADAVRATAHPLPETADRYDRLLELVGDARLVLLGEATHGTREFYRERAEITKRLVAQRGFLGIAVEADWPDARRVDRYVRHASDDRAAAHALASFRRFPTWMWRNAEVATFVEWLRDYNFAALGEASKVGWYGIDLYNLRAAIDAVLAYLERVDARAAQRVRARYACFDDFGEAPQGHTFLTSWRVTKSCKEEATAGLLELQHPARAGDPREEDAFFDAVQNARLVKNAEAFYRTLFRSETTAWNTRARHMADTLDALLEDFERSGRPARLVVWAHNAHCGDARATELGRHGEMSVGQLMRERHGREALLVGFTTYQGTVTAAPDWERPVERQRLRPARDGSYEATFHRAGFDRFVLPCRDIDRVPAPLRDSRLERQIGVIYRPDNERGSHYVSARLPEQFDAVVHIDETEAVEPLAPTRGWKGGEVPQTFPFAV